MNLDEIFLNINAVGFDSIVCQANIHTVEDICKYNQQGYHIELTKDEFQKRFDIDVNHVWYTPSISMSCFYFNQDTLAVCPLHIEFFIANPNGNHSLNLDISHVYKAIQQQEAEVEKHNYMSSLLALTDTMRLEYFKMLIDKKGKDIPGLYQLFMANYTQSDYGFERMDKDTLTIIFDSKTDVDKIKTNEEIAELPDVITVYRGGNSESTPYDKAYSWTLDVNVANMFACRRGKGPAYIAKGQVQKDDILECFMKNNKEQEIIVDPNKITDISLMNIKGLDFLSEVLPEVAPMYHFYKDKMNQLDFYRESMVHGKEHQARVLLYCLIISEIMNLSMSERRVLAEAAIYHDTQRVNDDVDREHGQASARYYRNHANKPNPLVEFICEYHCLPDEEGYEKIKRDRYLSKNRSKSTMLFNIFKDADALDRLRLGGIQHELDLNQLRMDVSKELTLVSRICLEQVKL